MATVEDFESVLKDVVQAKRLSASKMEKLKDIALRCIEHDTQLVSILYRTHKSLPPISKVNSLYVFDALCRAARHQATKNGLTGDSNIESGNAATFLIKVEGVLDGLFRDMIKIGNTECKEKARKILDIWVKGNTFPPPILARLTDVVTEKEQVREPTTLSTTDPRTSGQSTASATPPTVSPVTPVPPTLDPQATLLALLTQAAKAATVSSSGQTHPNMAVAAAGSSQVDANQLALLQHLAQTTGASSSRAPVDILREKPQSPSHHRDYPPRKDPRHERYRSPDREYGDHHNEDRTYPRGGYRGFRARGRGDSRRWEDRERYQDRDRVRDRDRSPPHRVRHSRSRSPPRFGGHRAAPYSPPGRAVTQTPLADVKAAGPDKDEFGRDIRPDSPTHVPAPVQTSTPPVPPSSASPIDKSVVESAPALATNHDRMSLSPLVAANTSANNSNASFVSNTLSTQAGMESFDLATFDFTSASSWEGLGKMWQITYGYLPSTEQLMQFVMSGGQVVAAGKTNGNQAWSGYGEADGANQMWRGGGRGRGGGGFRGGRGRGGFGYGKGRDGHEGAGWHQDGMDQPTDAIVLGEDTSTEPMDSQQDPSTENRNGNPGGRMQRIGDKWVFVREPAPS